MSRNPAADGARVFETAWSRSAVARRATPRPRPQPAWARLRWPSAPRTWTLQARRWPRAPADLADAIVLETGKLRSEAAAEVQLLLVRFDLVARSWSSAIWRAHRAGRPSEKLRYHPLGVVGVIGPFNFPLHLCHAHVVPALLHRQHGRGQAERRHAAGRPALRRGGARRRAAARRVQPGPGGGAVGAALVAHPAVRGLCFTG